MGILIKEQNFTQTFIREIKPLLLRQWKEIAHYKEIPLDPDWDQYYNLFMMGKLKIISARKGGKLIGYAIYIVNHNLHYKGSLQAVQDVLFLDEEYRRGTLGTKLIKKADEILQTMGVDVVIHHVKVAHDFSKILERQGYTLVEKILSKRLN